MRRSTSALPMEKPASRQPRSLFDAAFVLFLLLNATLILRPGDLWPSLVGLPIYELLLLAALAAAHRRVFESLTWSALSKQPVSVCVLGLLPAALLSHLSHGYFGGAVEAAKVFVRILLYYALFVSVVDSSRRLRVFLFALAVFSSCAVALCVVDYYGWVDLPFIQHVVELDGATATGEAARVLRMRGVGIFSDPNDLSLLIVAAGVACLYFLTDRRLGPFRFLWLVPLGVLSVGLLSTHSRGGLLAAGAAALVYVYLRHGWRPALALALVGLAGLSVLGGRQAHIELESGTGHERILLWRDGFVAIQSAALLFGTGVGTYEDIAGLVAHNSFVHAFVEMGVFGGTLFFGCFFFTGLALFRLRNRWRRLQHPELRRLFPFVAALLAGWCTGMLSLSRCYVEPTYMVASIGAVYVNRVRLCVPESALGIRWDAGHLLRLVSASAALFLLLYAATVALA